MGEKYQLHFETNQYMDENDDPVELSFILNRFGDNILDVMPDGLSYLLIDTCKTGNIDLVKKLLSHGADVNTKDDGNTPLYYASRKGHTKIVKLLLEHGADVNAKNNYGETSLYWASRIGHTEIVKLLLEYGADVNAKDIGESTALIWASVKGYSAIVNLLKQYGATE